MSIKPTLGIKNIAIFLLKAYFPYKANSITEKGFLERTIAL